MSKLPQILALLASLVLGPAASAQQPQQTAPQSPQFATPAPVAPLFFREGWRQTAAFDASTAFQPERGVTPAAVTNPGLELKLYDPGAKNVPAYAKTPPPGSIARDWTGPSCIQLAGYNQDPPPKQVVAGQPTDPPNLWTGVCA